MKRPDEPRRGGWLVAKGEALEIAASPEATSPAGAEESYLHPFQGFDFFPILYQGFALRY